jgi:hypothetical protein
MKANGDISLCKLISEEARRFSRSSALVIITPLQTGQLASILDAVRTPPELTTVIVLSEAGIEENNRTFFIKSLRTRGEQVHIIRPGQNLTTALDSRFRARRMSAPGRRLHTVMEPAL